MKCYIIGINFDKYTLLSKITKHMKEAYGCEVSFIDWLGKAEVDLSICNVDDVYIYVEVQSLLNHELEMNIDIGDDKVAIAQKFGRLNRKIEVFYAANNTTNQAHMEEVISQITEILLEPEYVSDDNNIANIDIANLPIVKSNNNVSSLVGINVIIDNKEYYISKEDFESLYQLDEMLSKHGYKLSSIAVSD